VDNVFKLIKLHLHYFYGILKCFIYSFIDIKTWKHICILGFLLFKTPFIICETKLFIFKMHGIPYIDDYEGLKLKKTCNNVLMW